jgi:hypothetical protein
MANTSNSAQTRADFRLIFTPNLATGEVVQDFVLTPQGDIALVTGIDRLVQMIILWLLTPLGVNPWDTTYGNPYYSQLGRIAGPDLQETYLAMLDTCQAAFLSTQEQAAQAGQLTQDEMVAKFSAQHISVVGVGQVMVSFTIVAQSGASTSVNVPFASGLASGQAN